MCGITGLFSSNGLGSNLTAFIKATEIISHRGPDGQGYALFNTCNPGKTLFVNYDTLPHSIESNNVTLALGHRRLAIIDLSPAGRQPMSNEDGTVWITYNGEIYNYTELRQQLMRLGHSFRSHSDTEVVIHAFEEWGKSCINRFNGIWAFALIDLAHNMLFCSRDRSLFITTFMGKFGFSPVR